MNKQAGFTLVEVLIAAVILFSALAITADLYKASSFTANKIIQKANYYQTTPLLISTIKADIHHKVKQRRQAQFSGQTIANGAQYSWQATRISFKSRTKGIDESFEPPLQFGLYQVEVSKEGTNDVFTFKVATW